MGESSARDYLAVSGLPADSAFHTAEVSISFGEEIDFAALRAAWEALATAAPALRSRFDADGKLEIPKTPSFAWNELDWQAALPADPGMEWQRIVEAETTTAIAAGDQPAARFTVVRLPNGHGHALWSFHAAVLDEDAAFHALQSWLAIYDSIRTGAGIPEMPVPVAVDRPSSDQSWTAAFEGFVPTPRLIILPLPSGAHDPSVRKSISHTYERPERTEFAEAAARWGGGLDALFGAVWAFVLARATSADDALLLEPVRTQATLERGEILVARRHRVSALRTPKDLVQSFAREASEPPPPADFAAAARALDIPALEPSAAWIFRDHTLNDRLQLSMPRWMAADVKLSQRSAAPVTLRVVATDRPEIALDYNPSILSDEGAGVLFNLYRSVLTAFIADPTLDLESFALPGPEGVIEGPELPPTFRSLVPQGIHEMFADVATEAPDAPAIQLDGEVISFSKLNALANQFARHLRKRGVEPGTRVGISVARSPRWIALLLGTLRAGGVIVPLPASTFETPTDVKFLVVDSLPSDAPKNEHIIDLTAEEASLHAEKPRGIQTDADSRATAASWQINGTTTSFSHEQLVAAFQSTAALMTLDSGSRVLQFAPTGAASAIEEVFTTLLSGATLVIRSDDRWSTRTAFQEYVEENAITHLAIPAAFCSQWIHYLSELSLRVPSSLRIVAIEGELPPALTTEWERLSSSAQLVFRLSCAAAGGLSLATNSSRGFFLPSPAARVRIVDRRNLPVPAGFGGSVEIASLGGVFTPTGIEGFLSPTDGILRREDVLPTTTVEALAATIRKAAASHASIFDAHAEAREIDGREEWCLWIVPSTSDAGEPHDFREWLAARLSNPPRRIRALPRLPLGSDGRVDSDSLSQSIPDDSVVAPAQRGSDEEERLRQVISRALGGRSVDLDEIILDGNSRPHVATRLHEAVSRVEPRVNARDFTNGFSIRSLLRIARGRETDAEASWSPIVPLRAAGSLPPIIFIHDLEGSARVFEPLAAHLGDDQPCFALTARGLADPSSVHRSIREMASAYIEALQRFDGTGSYRLAGFGFGGLVAFEIATQLQSAGIKVPLLVMLATRPPVGKTAAMLAGGWKRSLQGLFGKKPAAEPSLRQRRVQESPVYQANQQAALDYAPSPLADTPAHIFVPEHGFESFPVVESTWRKLCSEARFYQVPCTPEEMLEEPAVEAIAGALAALSTSGKVDVED